MTTTNIEWSDVVWNPVRGCSKVSAGCTNCYAERTAARFAGPGMPYEGLVRIGDGSPRWTGVVRLIPEKLDEPLRWRKPRRVFVNSMSDLFHEELTDHEIARVFARMSIAKQHTFQVLTKRPQRMRDWLRAQGAPVGLSWPLPNVWLGVSVENQAAANERIPVLLDTPAAVRFLSVEPLLGPVDLEHVQQDEVYTIDARTGDVREGGARGRLDEGCVDKIDWVIVGGESGPGARPCNVKWIESLVEQCRATRTPVFVKQLGARAEAWDPVVNGDRLRGHQVTPAGLVDRKGGDPAEWPEYLRVRQFPEVAS